MEKIYRITLILLLLILALANIVFFASGGQFLSYFNVDSKVENSQDIINNLKKQVNTNDNIFDLSITQSEKFNNLKDFQFDYNDFSLPGDLLNSNNSSTETGENNSQLDPEFDVGNPNPFSPQF
ncbi:MAG TPA: hypothetical protein PLE28_01685 [bacterium]|nr:hypothetical protein [bacterium]